MLCWSSSSEAQDVTPAILEAKPFAPAAAVSKRFPPALDQPSPDLPRFSLEYDEAADDGSYLLPEAAKKADRIRGVEIGCGELGVALPSTGRIEYPGCFVDISKPRDLVAAIEAVAAVEAATEIQIHCRKGSPMPPLRKLANAVSLGLTACDAAGLLEEVAHLPQLTVLHLSHFNGDLAPLARAKSLRSIEFRLNAVSDLKPLGALPSFRNSRSTKRSR